MRRDEEIGKKRGKERERDRGRGKERRKKEGPVRQRERCSLGDPLLCSPSSKGRERTRREDRKERIRDLSVGLSLDPPHRVPYVPWNRRAANPDSNPDSISSQHECAQLDTSVRSNAIAKKIREASVRFRHR